jgi:hypothetical protein
MASSARGARPTSARLIIRGLSTVSAIGDTQSAWAAALRAESAPCQKPPRLKGLPVFPLAGDIEERVRALAAEPRYQKLDRTAYLALLCARQTLDQAAVTLPSIGCVSIGSSRGATAMLEETMAGMETCGKVPIAQHDSGHALFLASSGFDLAPRGPVDDGHDYYLDDLFLGFSLTPRGAQLCIIGYGGNGALWRIRGVPNPLHPCAA